MPQTNQNNSDVISDSDFPIEPIWVLTNGLHLLIGSLFSMGFVSIYFVSIFAKAANTSVIGYIFWGFFILFVVIQPPLSFLWSILQRNNFHYSLEEKFFTLQTGVIAKQNRQLPYASIQDITLNQSIWDRVFGLASLAIQNAAQTGVYYNGRNPAGSLGNTIYLPGLQVDNAKQLRDLLLEKMKINQSDKLGV